MFCFIVCLFAFFKVGANKKTPLCDTSIICSNKARTGLHSDLFSVFGLQSSTHIQPLTSFHPVGIDGREGFEQAHAEYHDSPLQTRSHDEHVLCGPQRVCLAEKGHPALRPTFVASCTKSQTQEFCALFSSSPAFVPSTWAIVWLSFEVSVSPWSFFQLFTCLNGPSCLGLKRLSDLFNGQHTHSFASVPPSMAAIRKKRGGSQSH